MRERTFVQAVIRQNTAIFFSLQVGAECNEAQQLRIDVLGFIAFSTTSALGRVRIAYHF
jgi:hypothetical protein